MTTHDHVARMDRIYRPQRWVYDPLRRFFLIGRDLLLERLEAAPGDRVLEIGCGTARNLIRLHRRRPGVRLYGLDASTAMLKTARAKLRRRGLERTIELRHGLAEELDPGADSGLGEPFDAVFFSYSLTMIPAWRKALDAAVAALRPGGGLYVVDFWDQAELPGWLRRLIQAWLARFHVRFRPDTLDHLGRLAGPAALHLEPLWRRYAYFAGLRRP